MSEITSADDPAATGHPDDGFVPDPARWRILVVLLVTMFMSLVGVSIVNVVLPGIQSSLGASESEIQWVLAGYTLAFGVVLVAAGRAGDVLGRVPLFVTGVGLFTLSSVIAGLAPDPLSLNIARLFTGIGSGLLSPQVMAMIQQYFRGAERGRAYGALGTVVGVSVAIGPLLGGLLVNALGPDTGWRATFLVNVPVGILAIVLARAWFPRSMPAPTGGPASARIGATATTATTATTAAATAGTGAGKRARRGIPDLDPVGSMLLGLGVLSILLPFVQGRESPWTWALLPAGLLIIWGWAAWERSYQRAGRLPMVDLGLFSIRSFTLGTLLGGLYFLGVTSVWVLVAMYMQHGLGMSALEAGLMGLPAALCAALFSHLAGLRVTRYGRPIVIAGIWCALFGLGSTIAVVLLAAAGHVGIWWLLGTLAFMGIAQGAIITPNQTLTLMEVPVDASGSASGVMQTAQRIGTAIGIALITGIFFAVQAVSGWHVAMGVGFGSIAVVVFGALVVAVIDQRGRRALAR